jgi:hypothetical protein
VARVLIAARVDSRARPARLLASSANLDFRAKAAMAFLAQRASPGSGRIRANGRVALNANEENSEKMLAPTTRVLV